MKAITIFLFILYSLTLSAQDRPDDFYVTKRGDTVSGRYVYGAKYDGFKNLKGEKIKLKPDSVQSYSIFLDNNNRRKGDPYYYTRDWVSINDKFYEVYYRDSGQVSIVFTSPPPTPTMTVAVNENQYYINKNGVLTHFFSFYSIAQKVLADCPKILSLLDNVPNEKNNEKTHKATLNDATYIISSYNECVKSK